MSRRTFLNHCLRRASLLLLAPWAAPMAQAADKTWHILMITFRGETDVDRGFRAYLADAGVKVRYTLRDVGQDMRRAPGIVQEIPALAPDLIYVWGTPLTLAVVGAWDNPNGEHFIHDIPVVFALVAAPVDARIVPNLEAPGRNVTGAVHVVPFDVQLRVMQNYLPLKKLGVLYTQTEPNSRAIVETAQAICKKNDISLLTRTFANNAQGRPVADGLEDLIAGLKDEGAQWLYLLPDTFLGTLYDRLAPITLAKKLPCFGAAELAIRSGAALTGLVSRYYSVGQLAAAKAMEILVEGKSPAQIPVERLKRFSLLINMQVAQQLQLYPPIDMLNYAEVIGVGESRAAAS